MMEEVKFMSDSTDNGFLMPDNERMTPIGAAATPSENDINTYFTPTPFDSNRLQALEQEQEQLNSSLFALTTHFAQVQFRLKQIVAAPNEEKERMLKELEEFAFRGCPDLEKNKVLVDTATAAAAASSVNHNQIIDDQRNTQKELIDQLKSQLEDLESYAYQSGNLEMPSTLVLKKQKVIIDELKEKINLPIENINRLSNEELKKVVDNAICQIVNPAKIKEQLVSQLKTQIEDLERFIDFLHGEASSPGPYALKQNCKCSASNSAFPIFSQPNKDSHNVSNDMNNNERHLSSSKEEKNNESTLELVKKTLNILQMYALSQMGCGPHTVPPSASTFEKNSLKKSTANHWGDMRANLELAITKVLRLHNNNQATLRMNHLKLGSANTESDEEEKMECPHDIIRAVRKDLACSLRDLLQHGLVEVTHNTSLVPFGCFVVRSKENYTQLHAWDLFLKYFEMKHGKEYTQSATNKLSQSFSLNVVAGRQITIKQSLLNAIESVLKIHKYDTSNKDSCFKAFVCLSLNEKKLVVYLKQILKTSIIVENNYQNWSYVKSTGFDDTLKSLDQLKVLTSNLPVEKSNRRKSNNSNHHTSKDLFS